MIALAAVHAYIACPYYFMACLRHQDLGQDRDDGGALSRQRDHQRGLDYGDLNFSLNIHLGARILRLGLPHARRNRIR